MWTHTGAVISSSVTSLHALWLNFKNDWYWTIHNKHHETPYRIHTSTATTTATLEYVLYIISFLKKCTLYATHISLYSRGDWPAIYFGEICAWIYRSTARWKHSTLDGRYITNVNSSEPFKLWKKWKRRIWSIPFFPVIINSAVILPHTELHVTLPLHMTRDSPRWSQLHTKSPFVHQ